MTDSALAHADRSSTDLARPSPARSSRARPSPARRSRRGRRQAVLAAGALAVLGSLSACGGGGADGTGSASAPASSSSVSSASVASPPSPSTATSAQVSTAPAAASTAPSPARSAAGGRCHTSELRAFVGRNDPGAGQENFPVVLTNASERTCTVRGYPGAAFLDASGRQLGPDPRREPGSGPVTVTLAPGRSAWAGLTFSNPEVSGAEAATPTTLVVTPPDERDPLRVPWTGGKVPVAGNASSVRLTVLAPGTGP
ncbi:DUF4232 domain-containing protein [Streptomyces sp. NPDC088766]|uniref:DUF4232 domain-containing protein n=1 Tax=Streptomyces sp. NPDC088766 TaxID=3365893 RepID=UPI0037F24470